TGAEAATDYSPETSAQIQEEVEQNMADLAAAAIRSDGYGLDHNLPWPENFTYQDKQIFTYTIEYIKQVMESVTNPQDDPAQDEWIAQMRNMLAQLAQTSNNFSAIVMQTIQYALTYSKQNEHNDDPYSRRFAKRQAQQFSKLFNAVNADGGASQDPTALLANLAQSAKTAAKAGMEKAKTPKNPSATAYGRTSKHGKLKKLGKKISSKFKYVQFHLHKLAEKANAKKAEKYGGKIKYRIVWYDKTDKAHPGKQHSGAYFLKSHNYKISKNAVKITIQSVHTYPGYITATNNGTILKIKRSKKSGEQQPIFDTNDVSYQSVLGGIAVGRDSGMLTMPNGSTKQVELSTAPQPYTWTEDILTIYVNGNQPPEDSTDGQVEKPDQPQQPTVNGDLAYSDAARIDLSTVSREVKGRTVYDDYRDALANRALARTRTLERDNTHIA
ncbi:MAG: hypothetical protein LBM73_03195, partial [Candidatus Nomurabacteria bacterium]|nr:hypothetical protein [Candidatus Nomurabacteria bacterium]